MERNDRRYLRNNRASPGRLSITITRLQNSGNVVDRQAGITAARQLKDGVPAKDIAANLNKYSRRKPASTHFTQNRRNFGGKIYRQAPLKTGLYSHAAATEAAKSYRKIKTVHGIDGPTRVKVMARVLPKKDKYAVYVRAKEYTFDGRLPAIDAWHRVALGIRAEPHYYAWQEGFMENR